MKAAVYHGNGQPLVIEEAEIDDPGPREVVVRTVASGVCHSDVHHVDRADNVDIPRVLGHEPAGIVEKVGELVTYVQPGDHVVACLSAFCGNCEQCLTGHPNRCAWERTMRAPDEPPRLRLNGERLNTLANIGSFAEKMLLHENAVVRIDADMPMDRAALLGCGVITGAGAAMRTARVEPGSTVAVFGAGGVGLSAIQGAQIAGARQIIAVDIRENKLAMAQGVRRDAHRRRLQRGPGGGREGHGLVRGRGGLLVRGHRAGQGAGAGRARPASRRHRDPHRHRGRGRSCSRCTRASSWASGSCKAPPWGSNRFRIEIPQYIDLYRQGRLTLDEMIHTALPAAGGERRLRRRAERGGRSLSADVRLAPLGAEHPLPPAPLDPDIAPLLGVRRRLRQARSRPSPITLRVEDGGASRMAAHYQWQVTVSDELHTVAAEFRRTTGGGRVTLDGRAVADWGWRWLALPTVTFEIGTARANLRPKGPVVLVPLRTLR